MTNEEARIVAAIVAAADGGCKVCRDELLGYLREKFPGVEFPALNYFTDEVEEILK